VLLVEPGRRARPGEPDEFVGVPYGPTARLIMIYLQSEALRTGSRNIELGRSMNDWFSRMDKKAGGNTYRLVRQQAERIATCRFSFHSERDGVRAIRNQSIVDEGLLFLDGKPRDERQPSLFREGVVLSESFFKALKEHAVPLEERAIRHVSNSSMAIDTYCWLAYRLHVLKRPTPISWAALHAQFGRGYGQMAAFKRQFLGKICPPRWRSTRRPQTGGWRWPKRASSCVPRARPSPPRAPPNRAGANGLFGPWSRRVAPRRIA
jgi:hypothetical protein